MKSQRCIFIVSLLACLSLSPLSGAADKVPAIDKVPEYEGVYLLTTDNELIKLRPQSIKLCDITTSSSTYDILSGKGRAVFSYAPLATVADIPIVPTEKLKGIYIVSRDEKIEAIRMLAFLDQFLAGGKIITGVHDGGCASGDVEKESDYIAFSTWGWESTSFRVKPVNQFTTYFDLKDHSFGPVTTGTIISKTGDSVWAFGLYVSTNRHVYPFIPNRTLLAFFYHALSAPEPNRASLNAQLLQLGELPVKGIEPQSGDAYWAWVFSAKIYRANRLYDKALGLYTEKIIPAARASGNKESLKTAEDELKSLQDEAKPK